MKKIMMLGQKDKSKLFWLIFLSLSLTLLVLIYLSLRFGAISYTNEEVWQVISHPLTSNSLQDVIIDIRLPRMIAAILVGAGMSVSGLVMQGVTRNPIADPGILGINAGAGLALILAYAIFGSLHYSLIVLFCLIGSVIACIVVLALTYIPKRGYKALRLILAGSMVATLLTSLGQSITIYFNLSTAVIGWQAGGLIAVNWDMLIIIGPLILLGLFILQLLSHQLTILSLDETVAKGLGQKTGMMSLLFLGLVLILSASSVAIVGSLSFVGLIVPHFVGVFMGKDFRYLIPLTIMTGACFMLAVDFACRVLAPPYETPISAMVSLIGLPCFLLLIKKGRYL